MPRTTAIGPLTNIFTLEHREVLKAVLYFDIFRYPLTIRELYENAAVRITWEQFGAVLNDLLERGFVKAEGGFILDRDAAVSIVERRLKGNEGARTVMPEAYRYSRRIASFPFVEGICLSGGLSKNYYDADGDIDYLILTRPNRLWICRSLLILRFKFLARSKKKFWCVNYFLGSNHLAIPDNNPFVGTELAYLIPTVNYDFYRRILDENGWYKQRFPNKQEHSGAHCIQTPRPVSKRLIEGMLNGRFGEWLDNVLLRATLKRWRKKYPALSEEDFDLQFRSRKNVCKRHTQGFQNKVMQQWEEKMNRFEAQFQLSLHA